MRLDPAKTDAIMIPKTRPTATSGGVRNLGAMPGPVDYRLSFVSQRSATDFEVRTVCAAAVRSAHVRRDGDGRDLLLRVHGPGGHVDARCLSALPLHCAATSKRSSIITLFHALTKSCASFCLPSSAA